MTHKIQKPLANPDFNGVREMVVNGVDSTIEYGRIDDDFKQYVWEAAMEAVYGPDVWTWWNKIDG